MKDKAPTLLEILYGLMEDVSRVSRWSSRLTWASRLSLQMIPYNCKSKPHGPDPRLQNVLPPNPWFPRTLSFFRRAMLPYVETVVATSDDGTLPPQVPRGLRSCLIISKLFSRNLNNPRVGHNKIRLRKLTGFKTGGQTLFRTSSCLSAILLSGFKLTNEWRGGTPILPRLAHRARTSSILILLGDHRLFNDGRIRFSAGNRGSLTTTPSAEDAKYKLHTGRQPCSCVKSQTLAPSVAACRSYAPCRHYGVTVSRFIESILTTMFAQDNRLCTFLSH